MEEKFLLRESGQSPEDKLSLLRQRLYQKAKQEPKFKFYTLYSHLLRDDVLQEAWRRVKENKGTPGIDGVTFENIEASEKGVKGFLEEIRETLKNKTYKPLPVKRVYIPKADGTQRPLGIPTIRDRVVQMAVLLIIEPIFEADFLDCSYGFRPERNAHQAIEKIQEYLKEGYDGVYDLDLKQYFDTIPHDNLMKCVEVRIADRGILKLIRQWLEAQVVEKNGKDKPKWTKPTKGTPQGGVISPLLANIYLHWFDKIFHGKEGLANKAKAKLVRYADDMVIMARYIGNTVTEFVQAKLEEWMKLKIHPEKTHILQLYEHKTSLNFLGFTFRWDKDLRGGNHRYLNIFPSKKALAKERDKIREMTGANMCFKPIAKMIEGLNIHLLAWANYFKYGYPRKAFRGINAYVRKRLTKHLQRRSQRPMKPPKEMTYYEYFQRLNLVYL